jgi:hypothetical protein
MFVYDICIYACVVGIKAPESLCYLLMYTNPTLNKDYLLTYLLTYLLEFFIIQINQHFLSFLYLVIFKNAVLPVLFSTTLGKTFLVEMYIK